MGARLSCLLLTVAACMLAGCGSSTNKATGERSADAVTLTLANPHPGDAEVGEWVRAVERLAEGALDIEVSGDWRRGELHADRETLEDVRSGRVDIGHIPARAWDTMGVRSLQPLEAPLLVDSLQLQERVIAGELGRGMLEGLRAARVEPLAILPGPLQRPVGFSRGLAGPTDYRGARLGLRPSAVHEATLTALGARVVTVPAGGLAKRLDGGEASLAAVDFEPFKTHARSVTTNVVLWPRATTLVASRETWDRLTPNQRAALTGAVPAAIRAVMIRERNYERGGLKLLCERGLSLRRATASERAALRDAVEPVYRRLERDSEFARRVAGIRALKAASPSQPGADCPSDASRRAAGGRADLIGRWRARVTREKLADARREAGEEVDDNWGDITLALHTDGRFELLNSRYEAPAGRGRWSARGDVLELTPSGSIAEGAGEVWRYRWTLFRGSLVLRKLSVAPTVLVVAPLRRE